MCKNVGYQLGALTFKNYFTKCTQVMTEYNVPLKCIGKKKIYTGDKHLLFYLFCFMFDWIVELTRFLLESFFY